MGKWIDNENEGNLDQFFENNRTYFYRDTLSGRFKELYIKELNKTVFEFIPSEFDIALLKTIAKEKSLYTNSNNQYDMHRTSIEKINKQFEGCLAEFAVAKFLIQVFGEEPSNVHVYDAERVDFQYKAGEEYDIKVIREGIEKRCEVRNSWSYKTDIKEFCEHLDLIGSYTNETKQSEELADFFIRPVLQTPSKVNSIPKCTIKLIEAQKVKMYIIAACTKAQLLEKGNFNPNISRANTKYKTVKINQLSSIEEFLETYNGMFK